MLMQLYNQAEQSNFPLRSSQRNNKKLKSRSSPSQKENFISKIAPIKIETQKSKNKSPRFRNKDYHKTTLSKSWQVSPIRQNLAILQKGVINESQPNIQTNHLEGQKEETLSFSNKSPKRIDNLAVIKSKDIAKEQEILLKEDLKAPKRLLTQSLDKTQRIEHQCQNPQKQIFSKKPYQKPNSQEFIHSVKLNHLEKVRQYLEKNKYIVFDFYNLDITALHWSSKKGFDEMTEFLIKNHADVDAIDILNRTPLYLAIQENNIPIMEVELYQLILTIIKAQGLSLVDFDDRFE
ncbi:unnamed protein product (macronuclear) [Paramecium tetraurelia]|uniref:Uncharacterized protein n=1 Tax=Paramecium tetraurelia TaxID=5888 RepID=A0BQE6_PARTE|nr:uncharacterized protein GSPATT00030992001 [Paramecium tetraurelia]CAK60763.1 unnamed protein product [Paramecium tetraurelia]|eukprot:XP_001428161.1 hypothetical protein (macronuclear) [Paramecium tetraurelia strain d4-2]